MDESGDELIRQGVAENFTDVAGQNQEGLEAEVQRLQNIVSSVFWGLRNEQIGSQN